MQPCHSFRRSLWESWKRVISTQSDRTPIPIPNGGLWPPRPRPAEDSRPPASTSAPDVYYIALCEHFYWYLCACFLWQISFSFFPRHPYGTPMKVGGCPNSKCGAWLFICTYVCLRHLRRGVLEFYSMCFHFSSLSTPCYWHTHAAVYLWIIYLLIAGQQQQGWKYIADS